MNIMAKRTLIWIGTLFLFATAHAQEKNYKIISGNTDTLQYNYFMQRLQTQFDHRRAQVNQALSSEIKLLERRDELRESFRNIKTWILQQKLSHILYQLLRFEMHNPILLVKVSSLLIKQSS